MKHLIIYLISAVIVAVLGSFFHDLWFGEQILNFSVYEVYVFFGVFAVFILIGLYFMNEYIPDKTGYAFLVGIFLKLGFFLIYFLGDEEKFKDPNMTERLSIIIPLILFLFIEVLAVAKFLKLGDVVMSLKDNKTDGENKKSKD